MPRQPDNAVSVAAALVKRRGRYLTAIAIAVLIGLWLLSGPRGTNELPPTLAEQTASRAAFQADLQPFRVRGRVIHASPQVRNVRIRGKTEYKRTVIARAEIAATVVARPVERGTRVAAGDALCRLSVDDRELAVAEAEAALNQAEIEHQASLRLGTEGLQSETLVAQAEARLAAARTRLRRSQLDLARTEVRAPFDGFVEDVHLEVGDYATPGSPCATLVDLDPILLAGRVPERDVSTVSSGMPARGILGNGAPVSGAVSFVGQVSDPATRSYALEIEVLNPDQGLRSGATVEILLPVAQVMAQRVSPALFALDDEGVVGVRTVDAGGRVVFNPVEIVRDDGDGVWVTGLPDAATLITVGQELVAPGQAVEVDLEDPAVEVDPGAPAAKPMPAPQAAAPPVAGEAVGP